MDQVAEDQLQHELAAVDEITEPEPTPSELTEMGEVEVPPEHVAAMAEAERQAKVSLTEQVQPQGEYDRNLLREALQQTRQNLAAVTFNYHMAVGGVKIGKPDPKDRPPKNPAQLKTWERKQDEARQARVDELQAEVDNLVLTANTIEGLIAGVESHEDLAARVMPRPVSGGE